LKKSTIRVMVLFLAAIMICGPVAAADITVDKTATKTGTDTANVVLTVNGPSSTSTTGADVVFSIDSSGSMSSEDPDGLRKNASKNFVDKMDPTKDQAGVVNWASTVKESQALTNDFSLVKTTIDAGVASGGTDFSVGLGEANKLLDASTITSNSKSIIFLSDGQASFPTTEVNDAKTKGYRVYTIGLGSGVQPHSIRTNGN
jgi:Mg-chelatase subunit ChlD